MRDRLRRNPGRYPFDVARIFRASICTGTSSFATGLLQPILTSCALPCVVLVLAYNRIGHGSGKKDLGSQPASFAEIEDSSNPVETSVKFWDPKLFKISSSLLLERDSSQAASGALFSCRLPV